MLRLDDSAGLAGLSNPILGLAANAGLAGAATLLEARPAAADRIGVVGLLDSSASQPSVGVFLSDAVRTDAAEPGRACGFDFLI